VIFDSSLQLAFDAQCELAESPCWDVENQRLLWVDILKGLVYSGNPTEGSYEIIHRSKGSIGAVRPAKSQLKSGYVLIEQNFLSLASAEIKVIDTKLLDAITSGFRTNDAEPDPSGRLLVGVMNFDAQYGKGFLLSVESDGQIRLLLDALTIPNGIAWSADGKVMYFIDSEFRAVVSYLYDTNSGTLDSKNIHCDLSKFDGVPDGLTIDTEGRLYVAMFGGSQVLVIDSSGRVVSDIQLPCSQVTSCTFGGENLSKLFISTAAYKLSETAGKSEINPGAIYAVDIKATGSPRNHYVAKWDNSDSKIGL
jgi:sugar lactone lactonase YvrE